LHGDRLHIASKGEAEEADGPLNQTRPVAGFACDPHHRKNTHLLSDIEIDSEVHTVFLEMQKVIPELAFRA